MRHPDMQGRHVWFLDGRIWTEWPGMKSLQIAVTNLLDRYSKATRQEILP